MVPIPIRRSYPLRLQGSSLLHWEQHHEPPSADYDLRKKVSGSPSRPYCLHAHPTCQPRKLPGFLIHSRPNLPGVAEGSPRVAADIEEGAGYLGALGRGNARGSLPGVFFRWCLPGWAWERGAEGAADDDQQHRTGGREIFRWEVAKGRGREFCRLRT